MLPWVVIPRSFSAAILIVIWYESPFDYIVVLLILPTSNGNVLRDIWGPQWRLSRGLVAHGHRMPP